MEVKGVLSSCIVEIRVKSCLKNRPHFYLSKYYVFRGEEFWGCLLNIETEFDPTLVKSKLFTIDHEKIN